MTNLMLPVHRVRLEVDRSLRANAFFSRAIRGELSGDECADLVRQLEELRASASPRRAIRPRSVACGPSSVVESELRGSRHTELACPAVEHFRPVTRGFCDCLGERLVEHVGMAILGTSWTQDAAERLEQRFPDASSRLDDMSTRASASVRSIAEAIASKAADPQHVYSFTELMRGALLALAVYLNTRWPAPVLCVADHTQED